MRLSHFPLTHIVNLTWHCTVTTHANPFLPHTFQLLIPYYTTVQVVNQLLKTHVSNYISNTIILFTLSSLHWIPLFTYHHDLALIITRTFSPTFSLWYVFSSSSFS
jgi:hypothetical protein